MRKHMLLGSAAVLVVLSYGAGAQTTNKEQTNRTAPAVQSTAPVPSSGTSAQSGGAPGQTSDSTATPNTPRGTTPATSSANAATQSQPPAARATGSTTAPDTTQHSGTAVTNPAPANPAPSGTAQRNNPQTPSGQAPSTAPQTAPQRTAPQTPSTQQQATQPNANAGTQTQQATQPQATQPNGAAQQNAQRTQAPGGVVSLDVKQRTEIGRTIARHNVKPVTNVNFSIAVGTAVPRSVQLRALPADLVSFVPQYRGYSYFVVEEQIVIVEPSSTQIVAVIAYAGGSATRAAAPAPTKSRAVKLSTQEREVIRRHTSKPSAARRDSEAPARKSSRRYSVGDEVETTETIETFPETVYREAPRVRRYRYLRQDDNVILVDPDDHRVVDIFD